MNRATPIVTERSDVATAHRRPMPWVSHEPRTVWRAWRVVPDLRSFSGGPMLAGLFGFPWRSVELDAKCTIRDPAGGGSPLHRQWVDRHHPVVPDAECTCGIYASADEFSQASLDVAPRGQPLVTGFVELSGRTLIGAGVARAQHARIIGPLTILGGREPIAAAMASILGVARRPQRVVSDRDQYRVVWVSSRVGQPLASWKREIAGRLSERYDVSVIAGG